MKNLKNNCINIWLPEEGFVYLQGKIKVMKKVIKYINNNIVEFKAILDTAILAGMVFAAAMACKFVLLYFA